VPGAIDPAPFAAAVEPLPCSRRGAVSLPFGLRLDAATRAGTCCLEAFALEFGGDPQVGLILKVWSSNGYTLGDLRAQADGALRQRLGRVVAEFPHIHLWWERIRPGRLPPALPSGGCVRAGHAGEGWGRPLMEAMAAGLPTIATAWSGLNRVPRRPRGLPAAIPARACFRGGGPRYPDLRRPLLGGAGRGRSAAADCAGWSRTRRRRGGRVRRRARWSRAATSALPWRASCGRIWVAAASWRDRRAAGTAAGARRNAAGAAIPNGSSAILLQCARGEHVRLLELTCARHQAYARSRGMDYLCATNRLSLHPAGMGAGTRSRCFWRRCGRGSHEYPSSGLDADTLIVDEGRDLQDALPPGKWLGMAQHGSPPYFTTA